MMKKLFFCNLLFAVCSIASNAQVNITFEGFGDLTETSDFTGIGVTEYASFADQDGTTETMVTTVEDVPVGAIGNDLGKAMKAVESSTTTATHFPFITLKTNIDKSKGNFFVIKFLPGETDGGNFTLRLKNTDTTNSDFTTAYPASDGNTWLTIFFDISTFINGATNSKRIDLFYDNGGRTTGAGNSRVVWFDDIRQMPTLSINKFNISKSISPNPVSSVLNISTSLNTKTYKVVNMLGKTVLDVNATGSLDVSNLSQGLYFLVTDAGIAKFVKK